MSVAKTCPNGVPKCGARTRAGGECSRFPMAGKTRCDMHGGKATGPPLGNQNARKHGYYSTDAIALRRRWRAIVRDVPQVN